MCESNISYRISRGKIGLDLYKHCELEKIYAVSAYYVSVGKEAEMFFDYSVVDMFIDYITNERT